MRKAITGGLQGRPRARPRPTPPPTVPPVLSGTAKRPPVLPGKTIVQAQLVTSSTGSNRVTWQQFEQAQQACQRARSALQEAENQEQQDRQLIQQSARLIALTDRQLAWRAALTSVLPPWCWLIVATTLALGSGAVVGLVVLASVEWSVLLAMLGVAFELGAAWYFCYALNPSKLRSERQALQQRQQSAENRLQRQSKETPQLRHTFEQAHHHEQQLQRVLQSRMYRLEATRWWELKGIPFEQFLAEVLREHGYQAQLTKASSDQGVDVIATRGHWRIAIQAKGYPSGNRISNDVVLKVVGGMSFYKCNLCAVITNSHFTRQAKEAAQGVSCYLIDRESIPRMIRGQFPWG